jgi:thioredoxin 1
MYRLDGVLCASQRKEREMAQEIVGEEQFAKEVLQSDLPVLVDFWAPWCGPCKMLSPVVEEVAAENEDKLKVVKMDVDQNGEISAKYQIASVPTLMFFKDGEPVDSIIGAVPKSEIENKIAGLA